MADERAMYEFAASPQAVRGKQPLSRRREKREKGGHIQELLRQVGRDPVDISNNLVEEEEQPEVTTTAETQTTAFLTRPQSPPFVPKKTGVDVATQIEDQAELFDFDTEVEPLLAIIVGKTLEQSLAEVREEAELAFLAQTKGALQQERVLLAAAQRERERLEMQRWQRKEAIKRAEAARLEKEICVCRKVAAYQTFGSCIGRHLKKRAIENLAQSGYFRDETHDAVVNDVMPWLEQGVGRHVERKARAAHLVDALIHAALAKKKNNNKKKKRAKGPPKVNVMLAGLGGGGPNNTLVGPITLLLTDTIAGAERKIHAWLIDHLGGGGNATTTQSPPPPPPPPPEGGYLSLALASSSSSSSSDVLDPADEHTTLAFLGLIDDGVILSPSMI